METGLAGWAYRIRTGESGRGLPDWICVTTWPEVGASRRRRPFGFELHEIQLHLGPIFQRGFKRDADRIVTIDSDQARGMKPQNLHVAIVVLNTAPLRDGDEPTTALDATVQMHLCFRRERTDSVAASNARLGPPDAWSVVRGPLFLRWLGRPTIGQRYT